MRVLLLSIVCCGLLVGTVWAESPRVTLDKQRESVKVLIGKDVFTVYRYGSGRRKPFFQPVTAPGGFELLQAAVENDPADADSRKVFVASETAPLEATAGAPRSAHYGDILTVERIEGDKLWIQDRQAFIQRQDVAPLASIVTRMINDNPTETKNRKSPDYYDHPHHKGIWYAVDEINGIKFWMEEGAIRSQSVEVAQSDDGAAVISVVNHWLDLKDQPILKEETTIRITPDRLISYEARLSPSGEAVKFGDTKEGMFAIRLPNSMREAFGGGPVTNADGMKESKNFWGLPSHWVNYVGPVQGHSFGVTIMDAPKNPWPSRYHVRDYGLFAINPFGNGAYTEDSKEPLPAHSAEMKPGQSFHFRYGIWIHGGETSPEQIEQTYAEFCGLK